MGVIVQKYGGSSLSNIEKINKVAKIFDIFAKNKIEFKQITTSEISISYTVNKSEQKRAVKVLAEEYEL